MGKFFELIRDHPQQVSALVAMCAVLLSFLSIILTVTALWLQRRHHFKSLTPILSIHFCDAEKLEITLRNSGVGPLLIESLTVSGGGKEPTGNILDWLPDLEYADYISHWGSVCILPTEEIYLIKFEKKVADRNFDSNRDKLRTALSVLRLKVSYKDIYGRRMKDEDRKLIDWFVPDEEVRAPGGITPGTSVGSKQQVPASEPAK